MQFPSAAQAILFTLAYSDQFEFPLTKGELWQRLIVHDPTAVPLTPAEFKTTLQKLIQQKKVATTGGFFFFAGRQKIVADRLANRQIAAQKKGEVELLKKTLQWVPGIRAVFLTGSAALKNAASDDDLDVLIITKSQRLWLSRLEVLVLSWLLGKKKTRFDEGKHGWCFNLWLDDQHLAVAPEKRNLYQAYEVIQAKPLFGDRRTIRQFYAENNWIQQFVPNSKKILTRAKMNLENQSGFFDASINQLERVAFAFQRAYMKGHQTTEQVGSGFAFFHPRPTGSLVKDGWLRSIRRAKNQPQLATIAEKYVTQLFIEPN